MPRIVPPVNVPEDAEPCVRCGILMPVPGHVEASEYDSQVCAWCAAEMKDKEKELLMSGQNNYSKEVVARWARMRREGSSYADINRNDPRMPSHSTIRRYLSKFGYTLDGHPVDGADDGDRAVEPEPVDKTPVAANLPGGWGKVEKNVPPPTQVESPYWKVARTVAETVADEWQRIAAPTPYRARKLRDIVKKNYPHIHASTCTVDGQTYFYYRLNGKS